MKNLKTNSSNTFQKQFDKFHMLIIGSKMAKFSSIFLICFSFILMFKSEKNVLVILTLLIGIAVLAIYIFKFLQLKNINQKPSSPVLLTSSLLKLKTYMSNRKKFELLFISIWALSLIPFLASYFNSGIKAVIAAILFIIPTAILGMLAFMKVEKELRTLETQIQSKI